MAEIPTNPAEAQARRASVQQRLISLENELTRLRRELATMSVEQRLPGLFLTLEVADTHVLLPSEVVQEVVRLVELQPLVGAPPHLAGVFTYRGVTAVVLDLAALLGARRDPGLDAHLVVCNGTRTVALLVDHVRDIVEAPLLVDGGTEAEARSPWDTTGLMAGLCRTQEGSLRPLLRTSALLAIPEGT
ncbi:chemotaxis protein CheW [Hyalangium rubrum]|uniref:Chemotaxis protein CheW n=1 Tax=Hyalangium rubrum TaxID=3103134 RepID=A0ABU5GVI3_9BACT|nr:chemotaxis protein CheW [Hyalangium sp. s54d21]MDY7225186.1 chemotaxis protein CheW [Hyalangium sp. s54d21]